MLEWSLNIILNRTLIFIICSQVMTCHMFSYSWGCVLQKKSWIACKKKKCAWSNGATFLIVPKKVSFVFCLLVKEG